MTTIFENGTVLTMTGVCAQALVVTDGRIVFIGTRQDAHAYAPSASVQELAGGTLMPAFIDAHSHLSALANSLLQLPLSQAQSIEDIGARLKDFIVQKSIAPGEWVIADGFMPERLMEKRPPTAKELDAYVQDRPVVIKHQSGHSGVMNSAALKKLGITPDTPAPVGGVIGKKGNALTGFLEENAFIAYVQKIPMPKAAQLMDAYRRAQDIYLSHGVTTVQEGMLVDALTPMYAHLLKTGALRVDVVAYADIGCADAARKNFSTRYERHFRLGGYKIFLDGSPQGRTAWMRTPYKGQEDGYVGYGVMDDAAVLDALQKAANDNMQLLAHVNGDQAAAQFLRAAQAVEQEIPASKNLRNVLIHAQFLGLDQLPLVKALGLIPSFFAAHVYHFGDVHIQNFGLERAAQISPAKSAEKLGIPFTFHQDSPVLPPDMLETVWIACARRTKAGVSLGESERLTPFEALRAVTVNAAYQYGEERDKGTLEVGKRADMVVLQKNPLSVPLDDIKSIRVLATYKDGEKLFEQ